MKRQIPFKYSGNKTFLSDYINDIIEKVIPEYKNYFEPFLGSGAIFYNLNNFDNKKSFYLNDKDEYIYRIHNAISKAKYSDYEKCWTIINKTFGNIKEDKNAYYNFRNSWNLKFNTGTYNKIISGLYLLILSSSCINSMLRFGPTGMNQSFGHRKTILSEEEFNHFKNRISNAQITNKDFFNIFSNIQTYSNSIIFLDPPYQYREMTYNNGFNVKKFIDSIKNPQKYAKNMLVLENPISNELLNWGWKRELIREMVSTSPNRKIGVEKTGNEILYSLKI